MEACYWFFFFCPFYGFNGDKLKFLHCGKSKNYKWYLTNKMLWDALPSGQLLKTYSVTSPTDVIKGNMNSADFPLANISFKHT